MARGEAWLKAELVKALQWDEVVAESVVDVISKAKSAEEIQEIVNDYMENNPAAIAIISDYMEAKSAPKQHKQQQGSATGRAQPVIPPSVKRSPGSYSASVAAATKPPLAQQVATAKQGQDKWLNLGGAQPSTAETPAQANSKGAKASSIEQAEATLSMFKRGGKVKPRSASNAAGAGTASSSSSSGGRKGQQQLDSITANLERKVANCLSCGKIYNCRNVTNDIIKFIHDGFRCTFCSNPVAMTQQQRIEQAQQQQQADAAMYGSSSSSTADSSATARAIAFKDRLVDYDRNSQQRTTVIDNQSDYFEIDTNAWLSEEERAELRRREQLEAEAAEARRNKVYVTLDLLGRKVLTAEGPTAAAAGDGSSGSSIGAGFQIVSATDQLRQSVAGGGGSSSSDAAGSRSGPGAGGAAAAAAGLAAAAAAAASKDGGQENAQALIDQAMSAIRDLRISANPTIGTPPPVFVTVRSKQLQQEGAKSAEKVAQGKQGSARGPTGKQQHQQQQRQQNGGSRRGGAAARAAAADPRIQDDSIFTEFEAELLYDDLVKQQGGSVPPLKA